MKLPTIIAGEVLNQSNIEIRGRFLRISEARKCKFFLRGHCKNADTCIYNHTHSESALNNGWNVKNAEERDQPLFEDQHDQENNICPQVSLGFECKTNPCNNRHSKRFDEDYICRDYIYKGHCNFGRRCKYHHPTGRQRATLLEQCPKSNPQQPKNGLGLHNKDPGKVAHLFQLINELMGR